MNNKVDRLNQLVAILNPDILKLSILQDVQLDMETIKDVPFSGSGQENGPYYFVKKPDLPLNADYTSPQHPHFQEDPPNDLQQNNDSPEPLDFIIKIKLLLKKLKNSNKTE